MSSLKYVDIVLVKQQVDSGRLKTKLDAFGNIYLEDTLSGEAVKIGALIEGYAFQPTPSVKEHWKAQWKPCFIYKSNSIDNPLAGDYGWECSKCGKTAFEKTDWCTCGCNMRESNKETLSNEAR